MNREDRQKAEYLLGYIDAQQEAEDIRQRMETLRQKMETARRAAEDWSGGSRGRHGDLSDYFATASDIKQEWERKEAAALRRMQEIEAAIDSLGDPRQRRAMKLHYIDGVPWKEMPDIMHYGIDNIYRLRRLALKNLQIDTDTQRHKN
jgi:DNA-directed RNA polymerase specialized sigma24 family protein